MWYTTTFMVFAGGILSRSEKQGATARNLGASGFRVDFIQTM